MQNKQISDLNRAGHPTEHAPTATESGRYRWLVLGLLFVVYLTSSMDRTIVSIVGEPIKRELALADWELGLLSGIAFSLLYVVLGLPLARLADRSNRVTIISACLVVWSALTALCGLASNFFQLVALRMGVGVGEAGCLPTSHSLITDYFPPSRRTTAIALFGLGLPLGGLAGMIAGGAIADEFGWRQAFLFLGIPGLLLALAIRLFVREPQRGRYDALASRVSSQVEHETLWHVFTVLLRNPTARHILLGVTLATLFTSPSTVFLAPYLVRSFGLSYTKIGLLLGLAQMGGLTLSTFLGGVISDWAGRRDRRWYLWVPAVSLLLGGPLFIVAYSQATWPAFIAFLFCASFAGAAYLPPCYATLYTLVRPNWRATTAAIAGLIINLLGLGLGPVLCGLLNDQLTAHFLVQAGHDSLTAHCVQGGPAAIADQTLATICNDALTKGTRDALVYFSWFIFWPAVHFVLGANRLAKDTGPVTRVVENS